jgi:CRISPR/Cas system-associated exonuclease Cas4 (RecB family)
MELISKSKFLDYLTCPKDAWFRMHKPELDEFKVSETQQSIYDLGNDVEDYAKQLKTFSGMVEITSRGSEAQEEIDALMAKKVTAIYQPTFIADGYVIRCDVLKWNATTDKWDLYEIKASNSRHDTGERDHLSDAAFQAIVLEMYGVAHGQTFIVHLNDKYIRKGKIDIEKLFVLNDSSAQVEARKVTVSAEMEEAKRYLNQKKEPKDGCDCQYYGRSSHCATFSRSHPEVPEYSIHDLAYIGKSANKLKKLVQQGVYHIHEIEDTSDFTDRQQNQIETHKTNKKIVDKEAIANIINGYAYPLYFLDYETFAPAVPVYDGYYSYQRIPIQFSIHYIEIKGGPLLHVEYLHEENSDPSEIVAKKLSDIIDPAGTVLAWNVGFERSVTSELASRVPTYDKTLRRICDQMQDLMDVFSKQHYVDKDFKGSASIDSVMNALLPKMSYENLPYTGQRVGFVWWTDIVNNGPKSGEREKKINLIIEYCKQDTLVMVKIFNILSDIINNK